MSQKMEDRIMRIEKGLLTTSSLKNKYAKQKKITEQMENYAIPGVSIAVINDYEIEWTKGYGRKHVKSHLPITNSTMFQAGSASKPVFAAAVMHLHELDKLDVNQDINQYLTSWKLPPNGSWQPIITLRQLLSHTGGLNGHLMPGYGNRIPTTKQILDGQSPAITEPIRVTRIPGLHFRYSEGGYTVAQQVISDVCQDNFDEIMRREILRPLEMKQSTYQMSLSSVWEKQAATPHLYRPGVIKKYPSMAASGLWTTPHDLAMFGLELQKSFRGESTYLTKKSTEEMITPTSINPVGMGLTLDGDNKHLRFGHFGRTYGFVVRITMYRDYGIGSVIMANSHHGKPLLSEIERSIAKEYEWPGYFNEQTDEKLATSINLELFVGEYETDAGITFRIIENMGKLYVVVSGQEPIELWYKSASIFSSLFTDTEVLFEWSDKKVKGLIFNQTNLDVVGDRWIYASRK